ncbi:hypothetical protein AB0L13_06285 [Saccharopolyspora shandongensis]|uniref:hypothetical protein n=1 Tax=Saccharopolyspora shandongensis TaxID=418495 RepID=UPI00341C2277
MTVAQDQIDLHRFSEVLPPAGKAAPCSIVDYRFADVGAEHSRTMRDRVKTLFPAGIVRCASHAETPVVDPPIAAVCFSLSPMTAPRGVLSISTSHSAARPSTPSTASSARP